MAANTIDLVTIDDVKTFLTLTGTVDDVLLQVLVTATSKSFEDYCLTAFVIQSFTELHQGLIKQIFMRRYPITAVTSITASGGTWTVPSTDYWVDTERGILEHFGRFPIPTNTAGQRTRWSIVYSAGRFANTAAVTSDLRLACMRVVADAYERRSPGVSSVAVGDMSVGYGREALKDVSSAWPVEVLLALGPYRSQQAA